jgi:hypothetical protein
MTNDIFVISVWDTLASAWEKTYGAKKIIWGAILLFMCIMFIFGVLEGMLEGTSQSGAAAVKIIANVLSYFLQQQFLAVPGIDVITDAHFNYWQHSLRYWPNLGTSLRVYLLWHGL